MENSFSWSQETITLKSETIVLFLLETILADPVHPDLHLVNPAGKCLPQRFGFNVHAFRVQTIHLAAALAVKMGMGTVMIVGGQTVVGSPAPCADAVHNPSLHQQVQYSINSDPVDGGATLESFKYIAGGQGEGVVSHHLQHAQTIFGCLQFCSG